MVIRRYCIGVSCFFQPVGAIQIECLPRLGRPLWSSIYTRPWRPQGHRHKRPRVDYTRSPPPPSSPE